MQLNITCMPNYFNIGTGNWNDAVLHFSACMKTVTLKN